MSPSRLTAVSHLPSQSPEQFYTLQADTLVEEDENCTSPCSSASSDSVTFEEVRHREIVMVCSVPYVARNDQELNLEFAERVKVMQLSPDWCLVRNLRTCQTGYVPAASLLSIEQFLCDLQYLTRYSN